ncbi:hypothetical protein BCR35DRAFT_349647 [Leucosporidium creatinivorum]|uniref:Copper acquisition factor BIM1-like domain-containing protein n=1 Tax=Leucosporidium creatinivorum TaxID=106004 RepID=A0A1Y2G1G8_9BASI|nr:hypothetical protein BCR35DRAFT_349647 [Leucosporidium creatinivorum]
MLAQSALVLLAASVASIASSASVSLAPRSLEPRATTYTSPGIVGLLYPPIRGWSSSTVGKEPCGGFSLGDRVDFPLNGGPVALQLEDSATNVVVQYSTQPNPITNQFSTFYTIGDASEGYRCASAPTFGSDGLSAGQSVTFRVMYQTASDPTYKYQCADVTLVEDYNYFVSSDFTCSNATTSVADGSSSSSSSSGGLSNASSGVIGAFVTLAVLSLATAGLWYLGLLRLGKSAISDSHRSSSSFGAAASGRNKFSFPPPSERTTTASNVELRSQEPSVFAEDDRNTLRTVATLDSIAKH